MTLDMGSALAEAFGGLEPPPDTRDEAFLQWTLRRLMEYDAAAARLARSKQALLDWVEGMAKPKEEALAAQRQHFEEQFLPACQKATEALLEGQKKKSINVLLGTCGFRKNPAKVLWVADEAALLEFCRERLPQAIVVKETVDKKILKDYVLSTGDVPEGCSVDDEKEVFYVRPAPEAMLPAEKIKAME